MRRIAKGDISDLTERECNSRRMAIMQREYSERGGVPVRCNRFQRVHLSAGWWLRLTRPTNAQNSKARASEAPPGKDDRTNAKGQPEGWPFTSDVSRLLQTGSFTQQGGFVGFFPWEMFTTKVTVCSGFFVDWVQQIQHLNQSVWAQVEELAHQQGQLF